MKKLIPILLLIFTVISCVESGSDDSSSNTSLSASEGDVTITAIDTSNVSNDKENYNETSSKHILKHKTKNEILITHDFTGGDLCDTPTYDADKNPNGCKTAKTIELGCQYSSTTLDGLSVSLSVPIEETECENNIIIDISSATDITVDGYKFTALPVTVFVDEFEFKIDENGNFVDSSDDQVLTVESDNDDDSTDIDLDDVHRAITSKRTS